MAVFSGDRKQNHSMHRHCSSVVKRFFMPFQCPASAHRRHHGHSDNLTSEGRAPGKLASLWLIKGLLNAEVASLWYLSLSFLWLKRFLYLMNRTLREGMQWPFKIQWWVYLFQYGDRLHTSVCDICSRFWRIYTVPSLKELSHL